MAKLHEINALIHGRKSEVKKTIDDIYKLVQKESLFDGLIRTYSPLDDETGERLPDERQLVQYKVDKLTKDAFSAWSNMLDLCATQDTGNQHASADVVVNDKVILKNLPVGTLLLLEKVSEDMETFLTKLPTPDPAKEWLQDANSDLLKSEPTKSIRTKKVPRNHVLSPATDKHPAQVQVYHEDMVVGHWTQTLFSGRISAQRKNLLISRVKAFHDAVKLAREKANTIQVDRISIGKAISDFILSE